MHVWQQIQSTMRQEDRSNTDVSTLEHNRETALTVIHVVLLSWVIGARFNRHLRWTVAIIVLVAVTWSSWLMAAALLLENFARHKHTVWMLLALATLVTFGVHLRRPTTDDEQRFRDSRSSSLKPMIFPCRTTHTRFFPIKHSFSYTYLLVGIPVGWNGTAGSLFSVGTTVGRSAWLSVHADDYLARAFGSKSLQSKLTDYLASQNIPPDRFAFAYLVTAPRFLGYSFNPVSFWYLLDEQERMSAMILEVNNTFDERRMYFMEKQLDKDDTHTTFDNNWRKDFHVSPFNDRDGFYSLTAKSLAGASGEVKIDNNIVLRSDDGKAKIVARVFSTESGIDPSKLSALETSAFLAKWWWVGFMTNPRILREARTLWAKKLKVFYRPEVVRSSIGRSASLEEETLEKHFWGFLQERITASKTPVKCLYTPAAGKDRGNIKELKSSDCAGEIVTIDVQVLTPEFYAELVRCRSTHEAFQKYCFEPEVGQAMVAVSDKEALKLVLSNADDARMDSTVANLLFRPQNLLRSNNANVMIKCLLSRASFQANTGIPSSDFDQFVENTGRGLDSSVYTKIALRLLLIDRIAFGFRPLFTLIAFAPWCLILYGLVQAAGPSIDDRPASMSHTASVLLLLLHIWTDFAFSSHVST